jgi:phi LC3 family holin
MNKKFWIRRFKNKTFWISLGSSFFLLLQLLEIQIFPANTEAIFNVVLTLLTLFGILNDPTNTSGLFVDTADLDGDGIPDVYEEMMETNNIEEEDNTPKG